MTVRVHRLVSPCHRHSLRSFWPGIRIGRTSLELNPTVSVLRLRVVIDTWRNGSVIDATKPAIWMNMADLMSLRPKNGAPKKIIPSAPLPKVRMCRIDRAGLQILLHASLIQERHFSSSCAKSEVCHPSVVVLLETVHRQNGAIDMSGPKRNLTVRRVARVLPATYL